MKTAIIGAGIGGLTTALCMQKLGLPADIFEQAEEIKPVGAGIILAHNAMQVYRWLGLHEAIRSAGNVLSETRITQPDLQSISTLSLQGFDSKFGAETIAIHRGALQTILLESLPEKSINTNFRATGLKQQSEVEIVFENDHSERVDCLIGADGLRSLLRKDLFPQAHIRPAHQDCWRGLANLDLPAPMDQQLNEAWGLKGRFGCVQIAPNKVYWYALQNSGFDKKRLFDALHDEFHPIVGAILDNTSDEQIRQEPLEDLAPMEHWYQNRVVLLGDAAHATTPNMGQGACQAIEDAYVLSHCLANHSEITTAFSTYQQLRQAKANQVVRNSRNFGKLAHAQSAWFSSLRNLALKTMPAWINQRELNKLFTLADVTHA